MLKTGNEPLTVNGQKLDKSLMDFWRWNSSDLLSNATRGRLAEFIVASALDVDLIGSRDEWDAYDLLTKEGVKIEVKSSAYVQSWMQKSPSKISFGIKKSHCWDEEMTKRVTIAIRSADIYVFCVLHHDRKETCDPLNLDHWEFYVVNTEELNRRAGNQTTISLNSLRRLTTSVTYLSLKEEVERSFNKNDTEHVSR
jgi:hypothetical protein